MDVRKLKHLAQPVLPLDLAHRSSGFRAEQWSFLYSVEAFGGLGLLPAQPLPLCAQGTGSLAGKGRRSQCIFTNISANRHIKLI